MPKAVVLPLLSKFPGLGVGEGVGFATDDAPEVAAEDEDDPPEVESADEATEDSEL